MLSLNLAKIRRAQERFEQAYEAKVFSTEQDSFRVAAPVMLAFDIYKDKDQFRLAGNVQTTLELSCGRCLEPFSWPIDSSFDLLLFGSNTSIRDVVRHVGISDDRS